MMATGKTHHGASPGKSARTRVRGPVQVSAIEPAKTVGALWLDPDDESTPLNALVTITTDTTLDETHHHVLCDTSSGPIVVTLPPSADHTGRPFVITNLGPQNVTVVPDGSETINGASTQILVKPNSMPILSDGTQWIIAG